MSKTRLLIAEDDTNLGQILKEYLEIKGYEADLCRDGQEAIESFRSASYDLCILDVMMPKKDGFTLAQEIRSTNEHVPLIFLTAKSMKEDAITGLKIGADDYITKPFSMEELLLRLQAILKRSQSNGTMQNEIYELGSLSFDSNQFTLTGKEETKKLTAKEGKLLELFCQNINRTVDRSTALRKIWGDDSYFNARSMDVYVAKLRKMLKQDESIQIMTIHGQGFKLIKI